MTAHDDAKIAEILGYSAEVCEPDSKPITAYYTSRHLDPVRKRLVEYVESVRADERERIAQALARIVVNSGCVARCDPTPVWPRGWADADGVFPSDLTEALPELDAAIARGGDNE